jgi:hypothetical protein
MRGKELAATVVCSANGAAGSRAWLRFALFTREVFEILELDLLACQAYRQAERPDRQFAGFVAELRGVRRRLARDRRG